MGAKTTIPLSSLKYLPLPLAQIRTETTTGEQVMVTLLVDAKGKLSVTAETPIDPL